MRLVYFAHGLRKTRRWAIAEPLAKKAPGEIDWTYLPGEEHQSTRFGPIPPSQTTTHLPTSTGWRYLPGEMLEMVQRERSLQPPPPTSNAPIPAAWEQRPAPPQASEYPVTPGAPIAWSYLPGEEQERQTGQLAPATFSGQQPVASGWKPFQGQPLGNELTADRFGPIEPAGPYILPEKSPWKLFPGETADRVAQTFTAKGESTPRAVPVAVEVSAPALDNWHVTDCRIDAR